MVPTPLYCEGLGIEMKNIRVLICFMAWLSFAHAQKHTCIQAEEGKLHNNLKRYVVDSNAQVTMTLNLATSERISHRLTTAIFKIFLEEVVGYQDVKIVSIDDTLKPAETLRYLYSSTDSVMSNDYNNMPSNSSPRDDFVWSNSSVVDDFPLSLSPELEATLRDQNILMDIKDHLSLINTTAPYAMANMELWLPPGFSYHGEQSNPPVSCGTQGTGGRFGWYLPKSSMENNTFIIDHWRSFRKENITKLFHLYARELSEIKTKYTIKPTGGYYCPDVYEGEPMCVEGVYVPPHCKNGKKCATLFAGKFDYSFFVARQIRDQELLVQVVWIGPNLTPDFVRRFRRNKRLMFISWWPSPLTVMDGYIRVAFPSCSELNPKEVNNYLCKYELHTLTKQAWNKLQDFGDLAYKAIERFSLDDDDYAQLLLDYNRKTPINESLSLVANRMIGWDDDIIEEIACSFLNNMSKTNLDQLKFWAPVGYNDKPILWVAGIFPLTFSPGRYSSKTLIHAAAFAEMDINRNNTFLPDYTLQIQFENGQCKSDGVLYAFIKYIRMASCDNDFKINQMVGILGPGCSDTVEPLAGISKLMNTTLMSYSAEGAIFYDQGKYPFFFRTIPENKMYRYVYLQLFKALNWHQIASLTEDGNKYSEYLTLLQDSLQLENSTNVTIFNKKFPRRIHKDMATYLELLRERNYRIIIGDFYADMACEVMCEAFKLKMTLKNGFVWFLPSWFNPKWYDIDNSKMKEHISCSTADLLEALDGHFALGYAYYAPDEEIYHSGDTVKQWRTRYRNRFDNTEPADYGGYTYDAVWTYAFALDKLIKEDLTHVANMHSERTSQRFVQLLRETNFTGVSGHIQFGEGPSRQTAVVNIMQFRVDYTTQNVSHQIVGKFYPDNAMKNGGSLTLDREVITWFTENNQPPHDGSMPDTNCILYSFSVFLGVTCEMAILITFLFSLFVFTMVAVMVYIIYKSKYDKIKQPPIWSLADLDEWEIPRERVVINRTIGEGAFGTVFGGECMIRDGGGWDAVAVKTLKVGSNDSDKVDFLGEADMMKRFNHDNIIKLLGLSTRQQPFYMIMEFMLYGDLKDYLLSRRHLVSERSMFSDEDEISNKRLTSMAYDIAKGLDYLSSNKYVHRDVACRNCLVNAARTVKLSDFGMTRPMHDTNYYRFFRKGMLPVRWMAPESIDEQIYTTKTDVWSYGVLLYEIITFGNFPFQGMSNYEVLDYVKRGNTIKPPNSIRPALERLLYQCWSFNPSNRPTFSDIVKIFHDCPRLIMPCLNEPLASVHNNLPDNLGIPETNRRVSVPKPSKQSCNSGEQNSVEEGTRNAPLIIDPENPTVFSSNAVITFTPTDGPLIKGRTTAENGKFSVMEPLLPLTGDSYIARYACLQLSKSPDSIEHDCSFPSLTSV